MLYYSKKKSRKKHYIRVLSILIVIVSSLINPNTSKLSSGFASVITTPFAEISSFISYSVDSIVNMTIGSKADRDKVNNLVTENQELKEKLLGLEKIVDNKEYLELSSDYLKNNKAILANIIMLDNDTSFKQIRINKGSIDGIKSGDIVLTPFKNSDDNIIGALVGEVISVDLISAIVSTIYDDRYNITFTHSKSTINGIIDQRSNGFITGYLLEKTDVEESDNIYTSGIGGRYKKGIYIGEVIKSYESVDELKQLVDIKSPVNFSKLYEVMIVKGDNNEGN